MLPSRRRLYRCCRTDVPQVPPHGPPPRPATPGLPRWDSELMLHPAAPLATTFSCASIHVLTSNPVRYIYSTRRLNHVSVLCDQMGYQLPVAEERLAACRYPIVRGSATLMLAKSLKQQKQQSPRPPAPVQPQQWQQSPQPSASAAAQQDRQEQDSMPLEVAKVESVQPQQTSADAPQPPQLHQVQEPLAQQAPATDAAADPHSDITLTDLIQCSLPQKKAQQPGRARGGSGSRKRPPPLLPPAPPLPGQRRQHLQQGQQHEQQHQVAQPAAQQVVSGPADAKRVRQDLEQTTQPTASEGLPRELPGAACCAVRPCQHGRQAVRDLTA